MVIKSIAKLLGVGALSLAAASASAQVAPSIGSAAYENILFTINADNSITTTLGDPTPYDGIEDTLVGVLNLSTTTSSSLGLSGINIFGFDGDGLGSYVGNYGPTGYEGPNTAFSWTDANNGIVFFLGGGLQQGQSAYFSLEELPNAINTEAIITNVPEPETYAMMLAGLGLLGAIARRRKKASA